MEEEYIQPQVEPQTPNEGRNIKRFTGVLLLLSVVLVGLSFISNPSLDKSKNSESHVSNEEQANIHRATVNGMNVAYHFVNPGSLFSPSAVEDYVVPVVSEFNTSTNECEIKIESNFAEMNSPVFKVLGSLAQCYGELQLGFPTGDIDSDTEYVNSWLRLYIEACDRKLEPLGFPVDDGQCDEVPKFNNALNGSPSFE